MTDFNLSFSFVLGNNVDKTVDQLFTLLASLLLSIFWNVAVDGWKVNSKPRHVQDPKQDNGR